MNFGSLKESWDHGINYFIWEKVKGPEKRSPFPQPFHSKISLLLIESEKVFY